MVAFCPSEHLRNECHATFHLPCLASHFLRDVSTPLSEPRPLLPKSGTCPSCSTPLEWGEVIRGCYARREGELESVVKTGKEQEKAAKRRELEERRRIKALEKAAAKAAGRKRGVSVAASQANTEAAEGDSATDGGLEPLSDEDEDADAELMRSMLREEDDDTSGNGSSDDEPASPPPKAKRAAARPRATATAKRGRAATAGRATTTRTAGKKVGSGSESEGTRLNREMMAISDSN